MNRIFFLSIAALAIITLKSCSSDSSQNDSTTVRTSETASHEHSQADISLDVPADLSPETAEFCTSLQEIAKSATIASSSEELAEVKTDAVELLAKYADNTTPLSQSDRNLIRLSANDVYSAVSLKKVKFGDSSLSEAEIEAAAAKLDSEIDILNNKSNTLGQLCSALKSSSFISLL